MSDFNKYLENTTENTTWEGKFENLPDFEGIFKLENAEVETSKTGLWRVRFSWIVKENLDDADDAIGVVDKTQLQFAQLENSSGWNPYQVKLIFDALGVALPEFKELESMLEELVESNVFIQGKLETEGAYQNLEVLKAIEDYVDDDDSEELPTEKEIKKMKKDELTELADEYEIELSGKSPKVIKKEIIEFFENYEDDDEEDDDEDSEEETELPDVDDVADMGKEELLEIIDEHEITVKGKKTVKAMKKAIVEFIEEAEEEEEEEEEEAPKTKGKKGKTKKVSKRLKALLEFCETADVDLDDIDLDDEDAVVEAISEYEFDADDLEGEDVDLLKSVDLGETINEPKPKKAKKGKKSKKK